MIVRNTVLSAVDRNTFCVEIMLLAVDLLFNAKDVVVSLSYLDIWKIQREAFDQRFSFVLRNAQLSV